MPELSDTKHRRRALSDHSTTLLVEAGAGTGKTSLLAGRVALLLASGVHPRNVAAITFTELAASELLQRIQEYVRELVRGNVPEPLQIAMAEDFADGEAEPLSLAASAAEGLTDKQMESLSSAAAALDELTCTTIQHRVLRFHRWPRRRQAGIDRRAAARWRRRAQCRRPARCPLRRGTPRPIRHLRLLRGVGGARRKGGVHGRRFALPLSRRGF